MVRENTNTTLATTDGWKQSKLTKQKADSIKPRLSIGEKIKLIGIVLFIGELVLGGKHSYKWTLLLTEYVLH
jgi:hypothetical protein